MVKKVVWSNKAKLDRLNILTYWTERNKSEVYATKLNQLFSQAIKTIAKFEMPRRHTEFDGLEKQMILFIYLGFGMQGKTLKNWI